MSHIDLAINIDARGLLGDEFSISKHLRSIKGFAHGDMLEMLNITFQQDLIILRGEYRSTERLQAGHLFLY